MGGLLRLVGDEAVAAVFAPVNDRHGAVGRNIAKDEERVLEQVHLQDRFLDAHGLDGEALAAHDLERAGLDRVVRGNVLRLHLALEGAIAQLFGQAGLVLADLAYDRRHGGIDGGVHVARRLVGAEERAVVLDRDLGREAAALRAEGDVCLAFGAEEPVDLADLFLRVRTQGIGRGHFLFNERELHKTPLLSGFPLRVAPDLLTTV